MPNRIVCVIVAQLGCAAFGCSAQTTSGQGGTIDGLVATAKASVAAAPYGRVLVTSVVLTNSGDHEVTFHYGCDVLRVQVHADVASTSAVWHQDRAQSSERRRVCFAVRRRLTVPSRTSRTLADSLLTASVLGDSLGNGKYHVVVRLKSLSGSVFLTTNRFSLQK